MLRGIHTAMVTPFDAADRVDIATYESLCARQLAAGISGLVACGTTGETPTLSADEWSALVSATVRVANGRVPVTAGVGTNSTASTVENVRRASELGADAGLLVLPYYNKPNPDGLRAHVRAAAAVGLPIVLYHVPGRTGQHVPPSLLGELCNFEGVVAVKEATGDMRYAGDVLAITRKAVLSGDDFSFLGLLAMGGVGAISVLSNVAPAQTVAVQDLFEAGRHGEAACLMAKLWPLTTFLFSATNPVPCKAALAALDLCSLRVRLPLAPFDGPSPRALVEGALA